MTYPRTRIHTHFHVWTAVLNISSFFRFGRWINNPTQNSKSHTTLFLLLLLQFGLDDNPYKTLNRCIQIHTMHALVRTFQQSSRFRREKFVYICARDIRPAELVWFLRDCMWSVDRFNLYTLCNSTWLRKKHWWLIILSNKNTVGERTIFF